MTFQNYLQYVELEVAVTVGGRDPGTSTTVVCCLHLEPKEMLLLFERLVGSHLLFKFTLNLVKNPGNIKAFT